MAKRRRSANLGGLAALAALGYMLTKGERNNAPVDERSTGPSDNKSSDAYKGGSGYMDLGSYGDMSVPLPEYDAPEGVRIAFNDDSEPGGSTYRPSAAARPAVRPPANVAPVRSPANAAAAAAAAPRLRETFMGLDNASGPSSTTYDPRLAGLSSAAVGQGEAAAVRGATPPPLQQQLTRLTLGTPTDRAPGAPSIHAGPEAWQAYRAQQAQERAAQPATPQGSPRNIVQQMREKDKAVLAAVRKRQEEEEAARELARQVAEARAAERKRESARMIERGRQTNPYYGRTAEERSKSMRAEGGAIKAKAKPKKMASGGMTSASKRADGIASKGKTKCKMY